MKSAIGVNLESCNYWSRGLLYADAMRTAEPFPNADAQGNPTTLGLDANSNPITSILVFSNGTPSMAGTYKFRATGKVGVVTQAVSAGLVVSNLVYDPSSNLTTADIIATTDQLKPLPQIRIALTADPIVKVSNVQLWRPGASTGDLFYKPALELLSPFSTVRFMDYLATVANAQSPYHWSMRPTDARRNLSGQAGGGCWEHVFALMKTASKDGWGNIYVGADDDFIANWAAMAVQQLPLGSPLSLYLEIGDEGWNWGGPYNAGWQVIQSEAKADKSLAYDGTTGPNILGWRWTAKRLCQISQAVMNAYGVKSITQTPIRPVISAQWGNPDVAKYQLAYLPLVMPAGLRVRDIVYGLAQAPYCGFPAGFTLTESTTTDQIIEALALNAGIAGDPHAQANHALAAESDIHSLAYEASFDVEGAQALAVKVASQADPRIGMALTNYLLAWRGGGGELLCWDSLTSPDDALAYEGVWYLTPDVFNTTFPKYAAAKAFSQAFSWDDSPIAPPAQAVGSFQTSSAGSYAVYVRKD